MFFTFAGTTGRCRRGSLQLFPVSLAVGDAFTRLDDVVLVLRLGVGMVASLLYMSACVLLQLFASLFGRVFACVIPPYSVQGLHSGDTCGGGVNLYA